MLYIDVLFVTVHSHRTYMSVGVARPRIVDIFPDDRPIVVPASDDNLVSLTAPVTWG